MVDDPLGTDPDRCVLEREKIFGVTSAHVVTQMGTRNGSRLCDFNLTFYDPVFYDDPDQKEKSKETRGYREMGRSHGKFVAPVAKGALINELIILAGAEMSASMWCTRFETSRTR